MNSFPATCCQVSQVGASRRQEFADEPPARGGSKPFAGMTSPLRTSQTEVWSWQSGTTTGLDTRISWEERDLISVQVMNIIAIALSLWLLLWESYHNMYNMDICWLLWVNRLLLANQQLDPSRLLPLDSHNDDYSCTLVQIWMTNENVPNTNLKTV